MTNYDEKKHKGLFEKKIRWFLASRLILSTKEISHPSIRGLHTETELRIGHSPAYLTSRTLMKCLVRVREDLWILILKALVDARIVVFYDFDSKNRTSFSDRTPLQISYSDLGLILHPQIGTSDCDTFKAETDASFYEKAVTLPCGTKVKMSFATAASIIWNAGNMIDSQVASEFPCIDSERAELIGILSVLKCGKELPVDIEKIDVVTDNFSNYQVLIGKKDISTCKHADVVMAILEAAKKYTVCRFRCEPRESLGFVDGLAKHAKDHGLLNPVVLKAILENAGPSRLWGMPTIRLKQEETYVKGKLCKKEKAKAFDPVLFSSTQYYVTVPEPKFKFEALEGLISVLDPKRVVILADSDEAAHQVVSGLELSYYSRLVVLQAEQIAQLDEITACSDVRHPGGSETVVLIRGSNIPKFPSGKMLLVLFDTPPKIQYSMPLVRTLLK